MNREDNELLCRVGPGTAMGEFMRQFWIPATLSTHLEAGGDPQLIRLLGENFVAFRAHDGRVGFLDEGCPHRGVSLTLAHNRDCALTCIFHGWKIDVTGQVVDVPAEPPERRAEFAKRVKVRTYPTIEVVGIVFVWLGKGEPAPFHAFNWTKLPANQVCATVGIVGAGWLNGLEGQLDSAHVGILHKDWAGRADASNRVSQSIATATLDTSPRFEFEDQPYGYREAAIRKMPDGRRYVRVREYIMPWYSHIPEHGGIEADHLATISVPIDDVTSAQWDVRYNFKHPVNPSTMPGGNLPKVVDFRSAIGGVENRFGQDRDKIRQGQWAGMASVRIEDYAVATAQGAIVDRTKEHLSSSDISIVHARRTLREAALKFAKGERKSGFDQPIDWAPVRAFAEIIPADADWKSVPRL